MSTWMEAATEAAGRVYEAVLVEIVRGCVVEEREGIQSEKMRERLIKGTHVDTRAVRLMTLSGKGGWHADPVLRDRYAASYNVTLLDHLLSVTRGAMLLAALDWLAANAEMDPELLERRLRVIAAIAFLHDLDKMLELPRNGDLGPEQVGTAMVRYGIASFLAVVGVELAPDQVLYLIDKVEATQTFRHPPASLPPRDFETLTGYVSLADKLDGIWLSSDPEQGGLRGVFEHLRWTQVLRHDLLRDWHPLELFDPHHPFLLDELQMWLSEYSRRRGGVPPLIEVHQDGRLYMLLPESRWEEIVDGAIKALCRRLPFQMALDVSNRGVPSLSNGQPSHDDLAVFVEALPWRDLTRLFLVKAELKDDLTARLDELLDPLGLACAWPRAAGALASPFGGGNEPAGLASDWLHRCAHLALLLNLKPTADKRAGLLDYQARETELVGMVGQDRPTWLDAIGDDASRRSITALWAARIGSDEPAVTDALWGTDGLLSRWLEGDEERPGFNRYFPGQGAAITEAVGRHFRQLLPGRRISPHDEAATGRCLFTDEPVAFEDTIDQALGLYGVRVSAFSGRDARPESLTSERAHTNVGPVSVAEHKLRSQVHANQAGRPSGSPSLISSPTTSGLFGGLRLATGVLGAMSVYDLSRQEVKKGTVLQDIEGYRVRYRMARLERLPEKTGPQVDQIRLLLQATRRIGRPIHVFRGLPTPQRAFFHYDAMPRLLVDLLGGNSLRLEQIPDALKRLALAQTLLETNGLGFDVLRLYATPSTRFGAVCLAWCHLHDALKNASAAQKVGLRVTLSQLAAAYWTALEEIDMTDQQEGALVRLGEAAAGIQKAPHGKVSTNEEMLVFNLCIDTANKARATGEDDRRSLVCGITGELETNLVRKDKAAARKHRGDKPLMDGCLEVAELFVDAVWQGVLKQRPPTQTTRRVLGSIYRIAFLQTCRQRYGDQAAATDDPQGD